MEINQQTSQNINGLNSYRSMENEKPQPAETPTKPETTSRSDQVEISAAAKARLAETTEAVNSSSEQNTARSVQYGPKPEEITTYTAAGTIAG